MQVKIIILLVLLSVAFIVGCSSLEFPTPYGKATYTRFGDQDLNDVDITFTDPNGFTTQFHIKGQKSLGSPLMEMVQTAGIIVMAIFGAPL